VGVHGVYDASSCDVGDVVLVEVEVGSRRYIACTGTSKRGSGALSNTGEGRLLVAEEQPWRGVYRSQASVVGVGSVVDVVLVVAGRSMQTRGRRKVEPRACGEPASIVLLL
jgi:hypothetical protein